jgi:energy-coupling factor transport system ATP-binding protein
MFKFKDLSFAYPKSESIFSEINLEINPSEITTLTGSNGSGKTTFCRLIMGLTGPYSGSLRINDIECSDLTTVEIAGKIVHLKQEPTANIVSAMPQEDLEIWMHKYIDQTAVDQSKLDAALDHFNLRSQSKQPVWELSNGQLKRVGLSALLLNRDKYWILDEPTSGLDSHLIDRLIDLIKQQKQNNSGMLIISHRYEKFKGTADRFLEIKNKKVIDII